MFFHHSDSLPECAAGSKKARLRCMRTLVQRLPSLGDPRVMQALPVLLGEVLLGLKELRCVCVRECVWGRRGEGSQQRDEENFESPGACNPNGFIMSGKIIRFHTEKDKTTFWDESSKQYYFSHASKQFSSHLVTLSDHPID